MDYKVNFFDKNIKILNSLGRLNHELRKSKKAEIYFDKAITLYPNSFETLNNMAGFYLEEGKYQKSINLYKKAEKLRKENEENIPISLDVPENIVVLFMGELGHITWISGRRNISKDICNKELVPNQIGLPGSTIPNVSLSAEEEYTAYSTGIFDCDLEKNDIVNQLEDFEHYLIPTEEKVIKSMKPEVKEMLQKATQKGKKIINSVTLNEILPEISEKIPKDKYGFVYVFSCLGVCNWKTQDEIELYTKPIGLSSVRGYTVKKYQLELMYLDIV